jgi:hypothetical protein
VKRHHFPPIAFPILDEDFDDCELFSGVGIDAVSAKPAHPSRGFENAEMRRRAAADFIPKDQARVIWGDDAHDEKLARDRLDERIKREADRRSRARVSFKAFPSRENHVIEWNIPNFISVLMLAAVTQTLICDDKKPS